MTDPEAVELITGYLVAADIAYKESKQEQSDWDAAYGPAFASLVWALRQAPSGDNTLSDIPEPPL